jgi:hypothetical protein
MYKNKPNEAERQEKTRELEKKLVKELWPLLVGLKQRVDRRLVKTCLGMVMAILLHRHRNHGWLLSELGGYLLEPEDCQAGTKRISNLVHSARWEAGVIEVPWFVLMKKACNYWLTSPIPWFSNWGRLLDRITSTNETARAICFC